ncbi:Fur family transcriptional regulator [Sulfurimonas marina]|uniref:Transcriptional repressor n=1 Tax=Sulfurimonas marina TaxID=2590551 RepID=A0A7M1AVS9_9BACT|nr:Fur family transcriptional regulator [Sulfurimonas marina]QOP40698.1 transcriptional repressor [Sulfurimonas marina]
MENYTELLRAHNLKATPQRIEIANALMLNGHLTIEKLYDILLKKFNSISLATIYKNINIMIENAFIQEVKLPNAKSVYELTKEAHSHLVCEKCGEVEDIHLDLSPIHEFDLSHINFQVNKVDMVLSGLCKNCQ